MLGIIITVLSVIIIFQFIYICNTKKQIKEISHILDDIGKRQFRQKTAGR